MPDNHPRNADTLQPAGEVLAPGQTAICLAAQLGKVRLIDNVVFPIEPD